MNFIKEALDNLIKGNASSLDAYLLKVCKNDVHSMDISPTILQEVDKVLSLQ